ncbi:cytoskeletal motor fibril protein Fib [Spiroplasma endosymbiont of Anurida maritima]|uniref:cytoskeletal motor fibril protein Fib n=1 Tax=Spiroplasma endosymbiont of Anurida maritima TaxID=2967972 RepID=UPI0036D3ED27
MIGIISTAYFTMKDKQTADVNIKTIKKYWWKNCVIQHVNYNGKVLIITTTGYGKANAAMATTYLLEKYPNIQTIINADLALSTNDKHDTADVVLSTKSVHHDADFTSFTSDVNEIDADGKDTGKRKDNTYGQIMNEPQSFQFSGGATKAVKDFNLGLSEGISGTADMYIYNSKQFKEMVDKFGHTIDVIDTETAAIAQVAKKSSISFLTLKVIYNNALSPWDNDPQHKFKMYETVNTLKYLLRRLFNLLSSKYVIDLSKSTGDELDTLNELFEIKHDSWVKLFASNAHQLLSGWGPSLMIVDKKEQNPVALDIIQAMKPKFNENEPPSKMILGEDEWRNAPKKWLRKMLYLNEVRVNDDEILWNRSTKYNTTTDPIYKIEAVANVIAASIEAQCQDKSSYVYNGATVAKKYLLVHCDARVSFYISNNSTHEFVEDHKFGGELVGEEFKKYLNAALAEVDSPYQQIILYLTVPALDDKKIPIMIKSLDGANRGVSFGKPKASNAEKFTVVDIKRTDYDPVKVGSFKVTVRLKPAGAR